MPYQRKAQQPQEQRYPWCSGLLTCAEMLMHVTGYEGCTETVRESALKLVKADSGRKISCRTGDSNPQQYCAWLFSRTLYQLSYPPPPPPPKKKKKKTLVICTNKNAMLKQNALTMYTNQLSKVELKPGAPVHTCISDSLCNITQPMLLLWSKSMLDCSFSVRRLLHLWRKTVVY